MRGVFDRDTWCGRARQLYPLQSMLRIYLMQQCFGHANETLEEALIVQRLLRRFASLEPQFDRGFVQGFLRLCLAS